MSRILNEPYKSIWWSIPVILFLSLIGLKSTIDLQLHDTYFIIASFHIGLFFSLLLGIIGLIYWQLKNKRLVHWMTAIHVVCTIFTFILIPMSGLIFKEVIEGDLEIFRTVNQILFFVILIALFSQLIFITNVIITLLKNKPKI